MAKSVGKLEKEIRVLPDKEQLKLVDAILAGLDRPDPVIDRAWAAESRKRWAAYKSGRANTVPYASVMAKHRSS